MTEFQNFCCKVHHEKELPFMAWSCKVSNMCDRQCVKDVEEEVKCRKEQ